MTENSPTAWSVARPFLMSGIAGSLATCVVQPVDLIKTRMQLSGAGGGVQYKSAFDVIRRVSKSEGVMAFYNGLSAGVFRQATYTTARLGMYTFLLDKATDPEKPLPFYQKAGIGMFAGAFGACFGNPAEVCLIRMTADGRLPIDQRRNYKNVFDAIRRISKTEGVTTLWRGVIPTIQRAMILNAAQLATYSQAKQMLFQAKVFEEGTPLHLSASLISAFFATTCSMPFDMAKTRLQQMTASGVQYNGALHCMGRVAMDEGVLALWKGFIPYFSRLGPHTVMTFLLLEQLRRLLP
eukprot:TRINITY_DN3279_c0_g1_i1.p1 TRINITY_DN3279_c0_g1~~TRINITY_DN3279_c0_g1_i1.p1  ORF type:complete len:305 (-),score=100.24 TRINITY_DN3279_c0_g1_i1:19-903(-)